MQHNATPSNTYLRKKDGRNADYKGAMILHAHTIVNPGAMVIHAKHAAITMTTCEESPYHAQTQKGKMLGGQTKG